MTEIALNQPVHEERRPAPPFSAQHPWDRNFFLALVGLIWLGILMGFIPQMVSHVAQQAPPYPIAVHIHAAAYVGWLVLLTTQVLLIRTKNFALHRRIGYGMVVLGAAMPLLGLAAAWAAQQQRFGTPRSNPDFLAIDLSLVLTFAVVGGAGILLRSSPSAHKRLIIIATLVIADAGFARWIGGSITEVFGRGMWPRYLTLCGGSDLIIAGMGAYDLITRRRLHPAYLAGAAWAISLQVLSVYLLFVPAWKEAMTHLLGH